MGCSICSGRVETFGSQTVLDAHEAIYLRCASCGFLQVERPHWLEQAYSSAIADIDIGVIDRMVNYSRVTKLLLHLCNDPAGRCLDYGGGYGGFVRRMRDLGYNFFWYDKHCENLFAKGFGDELSGRYALLTAFELLEHLEHPLSEIKLLASHTDAIFASTALIGQVPPRLSEWAYYAPETGQHIAFYTVEAMRRIGEEIGMTYYTDGRDLHLFSRHPVHDYRFRLATSRKFGRFINPMFKRPTLLHSDFEAARSALLAAGSAHKA